MESLYNAKLTFNGEGNFTFTLPGYGDLTIYEGKDIYVKGLTVSGVEALRQLRPLLLEHKLNAKPDGCYKVIDLVHTKQPIKQFERAYNEPVKSVADMKKELIKGPIVEEKPVEEKPVEENQEEKFVEEKPVEETKKSKTTKTGKVKTGKKNTKPKTNKKK